MAVDVRTITASELPRWVDAMRTGFQSPPAPNPTEAEWRATCTDLDHTWGAFDGDRIVGTLRSFATPFAVPGGVDVDATALTHVTVAATHRRRGLLTRMITADLDSCAARGDAVSVLIAAEYPIYGRHGYGPAAEAVKLVVDAQGIEFTHQPAGSVELVDRDTYRAECPAVYERYRATQPGAIARPDWLWDVNLGVVEVNGRTYPTFFVLSRDARGQLDGFAAYRIEDNWEHVRPRNRLVLDDMVALDVDATVRLWRYLLESDWIGTVTSIDHGVGDPLRWFLTDARAIAESDRSDLLWLRILDTPKTLAGRRYLSAGRVVIEVDDPLGHASGRFALEGAPDGATCKPTDEPADLELPVQSLSSAYLGGYTLADLARSGRLTERRPGALAVADAMFRGWVAPWSVTHF